MNIQIPRIGPRGTAGILATLLLVPGLLPAEEPLPPFQPPASKGGPMSLLEAVRLTLAHEPGIRLQEQAVAISRGLAQQAAGQFDTALIGEISYEFTQENLTEREKESERKKRRDARENAERGEQALAELNQRLSEWLAARDIFLAGGDTDALTFSDVFDQAQWNILMQTLRNAPPDQKANVEAAVAEFINAQISAVQEARDQTAEGVAEIYQTLRDIGTVPEVSQSTTANLLLQLQMPFRTGVVLTPFLDLSAESVDYKGKPRDEDLGGLGVTDSYTSRLGFSVQIPLGRGRGAESTAAAERAANIDVAASEATLAHAAANSVLQTVQTYWSLVAAQERLLTLTHSLGLQQNLVELTSALIEADEMPRVESNRARAREAEARAQVEEARRGVHEARMRLAQVIGLQVEAEYQAPTAQDPFPPFPVAEELLRLNEAALAEEALFLRQDIRAASLLESSGRILWRAAKLDTRRQTDLDFRVSYSGLGEDNRVVRGLERAFSPSLAGPSARLGVTIDWPLANQTQLGRLQQQQAVYNQRIIGARDLERLTRNNVLLTIGSLRELLRQYQEYETAVAASRETTEAELEKLRLGTATLLDAIVTEQRQLNAELALVASREQLAQLLVQLRFDTGTLVEGQGADREITLHNLLSLPVPSAAARGESHETRSRQN